jgi:hypothetical protein
MLEFSSQHFANSFKTSATKRYEQDKLALWLKGNGVGYLAMLMISLFYRNPIIVR